MINDRAVVILSGGQDSTTALAWAKQNFSSVHAVTFDYGQRHSLEIQAAERVADFFNVSHEIIELGLVLKGRSPLTDPNQKLEQYVDYEEMDKVIGDRVELTFVPMRNALFLTIAANRAICLDTRHIVGGMCQMDQTNYPDCRPVFIAAQENMIDKALGLSPDHRFFIHVPLMHMTKTQSIYLATILPGAYPALQWTHTAYDNAYPPTGKDHATVLRAHGFEEARLPDPLVMRAVQEGLMELPGAPNYGPESLKRYNSFMGSEKVSEDTE